MNPYKTVRSVVRFERFETDRTERRLARAASVDDLRRIAKRRLPNGVFDYIDGAAEDERTLAANQSALAATTFRPRILRGIEKVEIGSTLLGQPLAHSCSPRPGSPGSPIPRASWPSPAPPREPASHTRSRH